MAWRRPNVRGKMIVRDGDMAADRVEAGPQFINGMLIVLAIVILIGMLYLTGVVK